MTIFQFLILFGAMVILGTFTIVGWYYITRGEWETMPDGSKEARGKLFKWWSIAFCKRTGRKEVLYDKHQLHLLLAKKEEYQKHGKVSDLLGGGSGIVFQSSERLSEEFIIKAYEDGHIFRETFRGANFSQYRVYGYYNTYLFPSWIRRPLATCATCFASVYGSSFYILFNIIGPGNLFEWTNHKILASLFFWVTYCFTLSVLNTLLARKLKS